MGETGGRFKPISINELHKMRPINTDNPRKLERFADIVERKIRSLLSWKETHRMQLCWKNFLKLYLASTTDGLLRERMKEVIHFMLMRMW